MAMMDKPALFKNLSPSYQEKLDIRAVLAYFFVRITGPACFYITYVYMGSFMKEHLGFNAEAVISQNAKISIITTIAMLITVCLTKKYHPLKIAKLYIAIFSSCLLFVPYWFNNVMNLFLLSCLQFAIFIPGLCMSGIEITCFKYMPVGKRYTILATIFGISAALSYMITSFSLIPLTQHFGSYGLWFILVPMTLCYIYSISYMTKLEKKNGRYDYYPEIIDILDITSSEKAVTDYNFKNPIEYQGYNDHSQYEDELISKLRIVNQQMRNKQITKQIDLKLVEKAIIFAKKWHDGQLRKTGEPYYTHPLAVANIVAEFCPKTDVIVAAILHDVIEDSPCSVILIESEFNPRIADIVYRLTRIRIDKDGNKIKLTIAALMEDLKKLDDKEAMLIKEIDRLHNLETIGNFSQEKQEDTAHETLDNIITNVAYTVDNYNIDDKLSLESKLLKECQTILDKNIK